MSFGGVAFATTTLPPHAAEAGVENRFTVDSVVTVTDRVAFGSFSRALLLEDSVTWHLSGRAAVTSTVFGVQQTVADLIFEKDVTVRGAGGLRLLTVRRFSLADSSSKQVTADLDTAIYNPSIVSIQGIGALCVNVTYNDTQVSVSRSDQLDLTTGWNSVSFTGPLDPTDPGVRQDLFDRFLGGREARVKARAFACEGTAPLFASAVHALSLDVTLPGAAYPLVDSMSVGGMELVPKESSLAVGLNLNATVTLNNPLGATSGLVVQDVGMRGSLFGDGVDVGTLVVPSTKVGRMQTAHAPRDDGARFQRQGPWAGHVAASMGAGDRPFGLRGSSGGGPGLGESIPPPPGPLPVVPPSRMNISLHLSGEIDLSGSGGQGGTEAAFAAFVDRFLLNDTVTMGVSSSSSTAMETTVHCALGEIKVRIPLHIPTTTVPAARGIPSVEVVSFDIVGQAPADEGLAVRLVTRMTNPSKAVLPLGGRCVFGVFGGKERIRLGQVTVSNSSLQPGANQLAMVGTINPPPAGLPFVGKIFTNYLAGVSTQINTRGERVEPGPGRPAPSWLNSAIADVSLVSALPGLPNVSLFTNMTVKAMNLAFSEEGDINVTGHLTGTVHLPFTRVTMDILEVTASLTLLDERGEQMAEVLLPNEPAKYTEFEDGDARAAASLSQPAATGLLDVFVTHPGVMRVINSSALSQFMATAMLEPEVTNTLSLTASQEVSLSFGNVTISNVSATETVTLPGLNSFRTPPAQVLGTTLLDASEDSLTFEAQLNISSQSPLGGDFGRSVLDMHYEGERIGQSTVEHMVIRQGGNLLRAVTVYRPDNTSEAVEAGQRFLSNFLTGKTSAVELRGTETSTAVEVLKLGLSKLRLHTDVPGTATKLIANATMNITSLRTGLVNGTIGLVNPTVESVAITWSDLHVFVCNEENSTDYSCGKYGAEVAVFTPEDLTNDPVVIPGSSSIITNERIFTVVPDLGAMIQLLVDAADDDGIVNTRVNGTEQVLIGGKFSTRVHYEQEQVLMKVTS